MPNTAQGYSVSSVSNAGRPRVAIIGGGLAGLSAAVALADQPLTIEIFEARRMLGGRATSYRDPDTGELIDNCQHVSMRCCTNLDDFCRRTGLQQLMRRDRVLHFLSRDGQRHELHASRWLPAPLHLGPALMRLSYLPWRDRVSIAGAMWKLMREPIAAEDRRSVGAWLREHGQSSKAIEEFWSVVLVSALSETVERASLRAARKVFVDGFMRSRQGYEIEIPVVSLGEFYGSRLQTWLEQHGVALRLAAAVKQIGINDDSTLDLQLADGEQREFDFVIAAVPWRRVPWLLSGSLGSRLPQFGAIEQIESAPITGIHLWFDREITPLPHAVLVGRTSQWLFNRNERRIPRDRTVSRIEKNEGAYYYQVVISASRELAARPREHVIAEVLSDLRAVFPDAREASLLRWKILTEQHAVFSVLPGCDVLRPNGKTAVPQLLLAGDWTRTDWPATMEGAVRSGYSAAEAILDRLGCPRTLLVPDLRSVLLARLLIRR